MEKRYSKAELLAEINGAWKDLNNELGTLSEHQMTHIRDEQGWTVKDHLVHMAAWERSVVVFLQGRPRYEGLGVDEQLYRAGNVDAINSAVQESHADMPLSEAQADLQKVHSQLMALLDGMSDDDIYKANSDFQPAAEGKRDERPVIGMIYTNTAEHFREHFGWIKELASGHA